MNNGHLKPSEIAESKRHPHISSTFPLPGSKDVDCSNLETRIRIFFDTMMDVSSINERSFILSFGESRIQPQAITYDYTDNSATYYLHNDLTQNVTYTVTLASSITAGNSPLDGNGNGKADGVYDNYIFHFQTKKQVSKYQTDRKPPYPILFVHGYAAKDSIWLEQGKSWKKFLVDEIGWIDGGQIPITLERNNEEINAAAANEVAYLGGELPSNADFFMLNFDIKANGYMYPLPRFTCFISSDPSRIGVSETEVHNFHKGDILCFSQDPFKNNYKVPYVKVIDVNYETGGIQISDMKDWLKYHAGQIRKSSISADWVAERELINISNLSSQASVVRQGLGVRMAIDQIKQSTGAEKVFIVGQSMGGLAAREYIQSPSYRQRNDVARLLTIVTPHYGSNFSNMGDIHLLTSLKPKYIIESDAVRDLRHSYSRKNSCGEPSDADNAPYLFGNAESAKSNIQWLSNDVNGDGIASQNKTIGLNQKYWPRSVPMACIIAENLSNSQIGVNSLIFCPHSDDIVNCSRQFFNGSPNNYIPNEILDTMYVMVEYKLPDICHLDINKRIPIIMQLFDEPYTMLHAFEIKADVDYFVTGFSNQPTNGAEFDVDFFKFTSQKTGIARLDAFDLSCSDYWQIKVYSDSSLSRLLTTTSMPADNSGDPDQLEFIVAEHQTYFIQLITHPTITCYKNPYRLQIHTFSLGL